MISGVFVNQPDTFMVNSESSFGAPDSPWNSMPASFSFADNTYTYEWSEVEQNIYGIETRAGKVFEVLVNVGDGDGNVDVSFSNFQAFPLIRSGTDYAYFKMTGTVEFLVDDKVISTQSISNSSMPPISDWTGTVNRFFSVRYTFTSNAENPAQFHGYTPLMRVILSNFTVNNEVTVLDEIQLSVKNIESAVTDIKTSVVNIEDGIIGLNSTVTDMSIQLERSNSRIWRAFKDSVSGLFVPSSADLEGVKNGFDQLAQDKLGGAYQSVDLVKDGVTQVRDKINNPTPDYSVEFPGIEVPLGEQYGTVRLIGRQDVTIPQKMRDVLYPIAGIIIPIVCTTWTVRLGIDMVNCFMSGMSYAQFLHRFTDEEDDEA